MKADKDEPSEFQELRKRAEDTVEKISDEGVGEISPTKIRRLIQELNVHRVELEMQNEELRRAQAELSESRDQYANLYDTAPIGLFTLDREGVILKANPAGCALLGNDRSRLFGQPFVASVMREDMEAFVSHLRRVFDGRLKDSCEIRLARRGGRFHAQLESVPIRDAQGMVSQCQTAVSDITEHKKAEQILAWAREDLERQIKQRTEELEQKNTELANEVEQRKKAEQAVSSSERRFRAIFEGAEDYIFIKDRSLRYTGVNPAGERLLEIPASKLIGLTEEDAFKDRSSAQIRELDMRVLSGNTVQEEITVNVSGREITCLETRTPLRDDSGETTGICVIAHDISGRKGVEYIHDAPADYVSKSMQAALKQARLAAGSDVMVLLLGESGSGKDYLARYIHDHSERASGPYFSINCASVSPELAESELFGHERGSFTGAVGRKRGLLELAEGGTLLLNEVGELTSSLQAKLLTFLDTRKFLRVGGEKEIKVNARLITATNMDLEKAVKNGTFRQDLLYRLHVMSITVPPLRERREDIPILTREILSRLRVELQLDKIPVITPGALKALSEYSWPGNVRELRNVLERAVILSRGEEVDLSATGLAVADCGQVRYDQPAFTVVFPPAGSVNDVTQDLKRFLVTAALRQAKGRRNQAARILGISRDSLKHYMKTMGIEDKGEPEK
jgi:PAS domain S-box-containing protein